MIENCWNVRGDEIFVFAQADYGGRAVARGDDFVRLIYGDYRQSEHSGKLTNRLANALFQGRAVPLALQEVFFDQVRDDFRVGLSGELVTFFDEFALEET